MPRYKTYQEAVDFLLKQPGTVFEKKADELTLQHPLSLRVLGALDFLKRAWRDHRVLVTICALSKEGIAYIEYRDKDGKIQKKKIRTGTYARFNEATVTGIRRIVQ